MLDTAGSQFDLNFRPNVELISLVRRFVSAFYDQEVGDLDAASRAALATHELLENAVKYSVDGETRLSIDVERGDSLATLRLRVSNRADRTHIRAIEEFFTELAEFADPNDYYLQLMERALSKTDGSGLGLARVRAEGEMAMRFVVDGDRVTIEASTQVPNLRRPS